MIVIYFCQASVIILIFILQNMRQKITCNSNNLFYTLFNSFYSGKLRLVVDFFRISHRALKSWSEQCQSKKIQTVGNIRHVKASPWKRGKHLPLFLAIRFYPAWKISFVVVIDSMSRYVSFVISFTKELYVSALIETFSVRCCC